MFYAVVHAVVIAGAQICVRIIRHGQLSSQGHSAAHSDVVSVQVQHMVIEAEGGSSTHGNRIAGGEIRFQINLTGEDLGIFC